VGVYTGSLESLVALVHSTMAVSRLAMEVALSSTMHASSYTSLPDSHFSLMKRALPVRACRGFLDTKHTAQDMTHASLPQQRQDRMKKQVVNNEKTYRR
jgi:hypothetical protein